MSDLPLDSNTSEPSTKTSSEPVQPTKNSGEVLKPESKSLLKKFFTLSTGSIGGAILIIVITSAMGKDAPWFVDRLTAKTSGFGKISLDVNSIFAPLPSSTDNLLVDSHSRFYISRPLDKDDWQMEIFNPGRLLNGLSLFDLPAFKLATSFFGADEKAAAQLKEDEVVTTSLLLKSRHHTIEFLPDSSLANLSVNFNPTDNPAFLDYSVQTGIGMLEATNPQLAQALKGREADPEFLNQMKAKVRQEYSDYIASHKISPTVVADGIIITTFQNEALLRLNPTMRILPHSEKPLLAALQTVPLLNRELASATMSHIDNSQDNDAFLTQGVTKLTNVIVDGTKVANCSVVRVVLYASRGDTVHVVMTRLLDGVPGSGDAAVEIRKELESFHVVPGS